MRLTPGLSLSASLLCLLGLVGCSVETETNPPPDDSPTLLPTPEPQKPTTPQTPVTPIAKPTPVVDPGVYSEVVYVFQKDHDGKGWMCTGTLVARDKVVTASHCLDPKMFVSYQIVAPLAPQGRTVSSASNPQLFGGDYNNVAQPDIGILTLNTPIDLPQYAVLTDIVARVEAKEAIKAAAVLRTGETAEAPLEMSEEQPVSSTVALGYEHGFGTPLFTKGGDSGGGLFLVENGKATHKLIGTVRQPEPDRKIDHFTRVDAAFLVWYAEKTGTNATK
jgi:hypothetical protein